MKDRSARVTLRASRLTVQDPPTNEITAQRRAYTYDPIGNRRDRTEGLSDVLYYCTNNVNQYQRTDDEAGTCPEPPTPTDRFSYDDDGNLKQDDQYAYEWDAENRLIEVVSRKDLGQNPNGYDAGDKQLKFVYDYLGRRVEKTYSTHSGSAWTAQFIQRFVYDGWNLVMVLNPGGTPLKKYTWGLDLSGLSGNATAEGIHDAGGIGGLLLLEAFGNHFWYAYDGNGNVGQLVDVTDPDDLWLAAHYEYDPYGSAIVSTGYYAPSNPIRFSTKWLDFQLAGAGVNGAMGSTGLYYYGHRYYSPRLGRWLSRDPIEEDGGSNLYGFLTNDPTNDADPNGLWSGRSTPWCRYQCGQCYNRCREGKMQDEDNRRKCEKVWEMCHTMCDLTGQPSATCRTNKFPPSRLSGTRKLIAAGAGIGGAYATAGGIVILVGGGPPLAAGVFITGGVACVLFEAGEILETACCVTCGVRWRQDFNDCVKVCNEQGLEPEICEALKKWQ